MGIMITNNNKFYHKNNSEMLLMVNIFYKSSINLLDKLGSAIISLFAVAIGRNSL